MFDQIFCKNIIEGFTKNKVEDIYIFKYFNLNLL